MEIVAADNKLQSPKSVTLPSIFFHSRERAHSHSRHASDEAKKPEPLPSLDVEIGADPKKRKIPRLVKSFHPLFAPHLHASDNSKNFRLVISSFIWSGV